MSLDPLCAVSAQTENFLKACQLQEATIDESHTFLPTPLFLFFKNVIVVQVQLSAFPPHLSSSLPQPSPPPSPDSTQSFVVFVVAPENPSPLTTPLSPIHSFQQIPIKHLLCGH